MRLLLKCIEYIIENVCVCLANFDSYTVTGNVHLIDGPVGLPINLEMGQFLSLQL